MRWPALTLMGALAGWAFLQASTAVARKTNQPLYQDPFDLAAGGASLTRASKDGRLYANPALLPQGGQFHRWLGTTFSVLTNKESVDLARSFAAGGPLGEADAEEGEGAEGAGADGVDDLVDRVFADPIRVGWGMSLSWVTSNFGLGVFSRLEPDISAQRFGDTGAPQVRFQAESYHGAVLGTALRTPWRWLSFGVAGKYVYATERDIAVQVTDRQTIAEFQDPQFAGNLASHNSGVGFDVGVLLFFQGRWLDFSFAGKVDDVGNTRLQGESTPSELKQVLSAGVGVTLHTGADALHLSLDYRDIGNSYDEALFKKVHVGAKLLLRTYLGLGVGYYNGYRTFGGEIDLLLLRVAGTYYVREMGDAPGDDPRRIYMVSISSGI